MNVQNAQYVSRHWGGHRKNPHPKWDAGDGKSDRDRGLLLAEVSITLNNMHVPLHALQARELKDGMTSVTLTLGTVNVEQLTNIMSNLRKIDGVVEVKRANQ